MREKDPGADFEDGLGTVELVQITAPDPGSPPG